MSTQLAALRASGRLRRVDAALGEWIARAYPDAEAAALAAALAARAVADGHSALDLATTQAWCAQLDGHGQATPLPEPTAWRAALAASPAVTLADSITGNEPRPLLLDAQGRVYLRRYFDHECALARALIARARTVDAVRETPERNDCDPGQSRAIATTLAHRFTLITGGPGTGKTYGVLRMLAALAERAHARGTSLRIALAAPTGKAAARLREAVHAQLAQLELPAVVAAQIPTDAQTVHSLIGTSPWQARPRHDHMSPLPFDVVVVDEVSMVDLPLMTQLVDAVPPDAQLILLGDPDQLAAVEAGDVLGALVAAARAAPLADCHVALTRSHRFAADSALGALARAVAAGDADAALQACTHTSDVVLTEATQMAACLDAAATAYQAILAAADPAQALAAARGFRLLTALRQGPTGCIALDHALAARLQRSAGVRADTRWWRGRLILVTANRPELGLFNGDTGVVWPDADGTPKVWFERPHAVPRAFTPAALPPHEGAFALTVHKAQGSEFERVTLVTGPASAVLTRQLLYTGITRARSAIAICADASVLRTGIERRTLRMSGLVDRLHEAAANPVMTR